MGSGGPGELPVHISRYLAPPRKGLLRAHFTLVWTCFGLRRPQGASRAYYSVSKFKSVYNSASVTRQHSLQDSVHYERASKFKRESIRREAANSMIKLKSVYKLASITRQHPLKESLHIKRASIRKEAANSVIKFKSVYNSASITRQHPLRNIVRYERASKFMRAAIRREAYNDIKIDEEAARRQFVDLVPSQVMAQATGVDVSSETSFPCHGPGLCADALAAFGVFGGHTGKHAAKR